MHIWNYIKLQLYTFTSTTMYSFVHSRVNLGQRQLCTVIVTLLGLFTKPHIKPTGPGNNTIFSKCKQEIVSLNIGHSVRVSMHIQSTRHKCKDFVYVICVEFLYINKKHVYRMGMNHSEGANQPDVGRMFHVVVDLEM